MTRTAKTRAHPDSPDYLRKLEAVRERIAADAEQSPRLGELAKLAGLSESRLLRAFRERYGLSPREYAQSIKIEQFKRALKRGEEVTDAVYAAGFGSSSRVYENVDRHLGMTPGHYRRGARDVSIRYTVVDTPMGKLLVATTERGICAVTLGDGERALTAGLRAEFPDANFERVDAGADEWIAAVVARVSRQLGLDRKRSALEQVPADLRATAFQWQVWQALMRIPAGQTRSYSEIARAIGKPSAARAVARACASNKLALIVPCHRVIRDDGTPGGYRWGLPRKLAILGREGARLVTESHVPQDNGTNRRARSGAGGRAAVG